VISIVKLLSAAQNVPPPNVTNKEIVDGSEDAIFALLQHLKKLHTGGQKSKAGTKSIHKKKGSGADLFRISRIKTITDEDILLWLNATVKEKKPIANFEDPRLFDSMFFLQLLNILSPQSISSHMIFTSHESEKSLVENGRYALSVAWKLGVQVSLLPTHFVHLRSDSVKQLMTSLYTHFSLGL